MTNGWPSLSTVSQRWQSRLEDKANRKGDASQERSCLIASSRSNNLSHRKNTRLHVPYIYASTGANSLSKRCRFRGRGTYACHKLCIKHITEFMVRCNALVSDKGVTMQKETSTFGLRYFSRSPLQSYHFWLNTIFLAMVTSEAAYYVTRFRTVLGTEAAAFMAFPVLVVAVLWFRACLPIVKYTMLFSRPKTQKQRETVWEPKFCMT